MSWTCWEWGVGNSSVVFQPPNSRVSVCACVRGGGGVWWAGTQWQVQEGEVWEAPDILWSLRTQTIKGHQSNKGGWCCASGRKFKSHTSSFFSNNRFLCSGQSDRVCKSFIQKTTSFYISTPAKHVTEINMWYCVFEILTCWWSTVLLWNVHFKLLKGHSTLLWYIILLLNMYAIP